VLIPSGSDTIQANDLVYVVVRSEEVGQVFKFFDMSYQELKRVFIVGAGQSGTTLATTLD
jgi:Trk K+ transport system NAD-binding subunit